MTADSPAAALTSDLDDASQTLQTAAQTTIDWARANALEAAIAAGLALGLFIVFLIVRRVVVGGFERMALRDRTSYPAILSRAVGRVSTPFLLFAAAAAATVFVRPPAPVLDAVRLAFIVVTVIQAAMIVREVLASLVTRRAHRLSADASSLASAVSILHWVIGVAVWSVALLIVLDNLGVDITALLAGFGVAGVAIGLAAQGIFKDLFSALSILFDKPFRKGDFIVFDDVLGEVEEIGLKTTRLRSLSGEQVVVANTNLLDETIRNYQRLRERRVAMRIGVTYQTAPQKLAALRGWIEEEIEAVDKTRFDRAHFADYGASSLDYEIVYFVESREYADFMDARHAVNLALFRRFAAEGVDFAYPTRTLMLAAPDGEGVDPREMLRWREKEAA